MAEDRPGFLEEDGRWTSVGGGAGGTNPEPSFWAVWVGEGCLGSFPHQTPGAASKSLGEPSTGASPPCP